MNMFRSKADLIATMKHKRAAWDRLIDQFSPEQQTLPGEGGGAWSVKDVIAHITFYERYVGDRLQAAVRGETIVPYEDDEPELDQRNQHIWERNRDRPLVDIQAEAQAAFVQLIEVVEAMPEQELNDPAKGEEYLGHHYKDRPIWESIAGESFEHYDQHMDSLRRWLTQLRSGTSS